MQRPRLLGAVADLAVEGEGRLERRRGGDVVAREEVLDADAPVDVGLAGVVAERAVDRQRLGQQRVGLLPRVRRELRR